MLRPSSELRAIVLGDTGPWDYAATDLTTPALERALSVAAAPEPCLPEASASFGTD